MAKGFEKCPCCVARGRKNDGTLRLRHGGKDGFLIAMVCPRCYERLTAQAQAIRNMAQVIVYGLSLNPDGGEMMIGKMNYKITRTETAYEKQIERSQSVEDAEAGSSSCGEGREDIGEDVKNLQERCEELDGGNYSQERDSIEPDDSPFFYDEEDFDKWREDYKRGVR